MALCSQSLPEDWSAEVLRMVPAFERENRIRELIQLFVRERDPETLKILAAELQQLLKLERTVPKIWRE